MKFFINALILFCYYFTSNAQPVFKKMFGTFSPDNFELKEIPNSSGNFIISNHNNTDVDHTFLKIDAWGEPYDQGYIHQPTGGNTWGSHNFYFKNDSIYDLIGIQGVLSTGGYPAVGFICKRDSSLQNSILTKYYSYRPTGYGQTSTLNGDSTYTIAGGYAIAPGQYYPIIFKLDPSLNVSWSMCYQDRAGYVQKIIQAHDNGYYMLMYLAVEGMALAKTDSLGNMLWCKNYGNPSRKCQGMLLNNDGSLLLLGYMNETLLPNNVTSVNPFIIKTDSSGALIWSTVYDNPNNPFIYVAIKPIVYFDSVSNNRIVLTGSVINANPAADMLLMLLDSTGTPIWSRKYGNDYFAELASICHQTSDGGFILGGFNNYQINNWPPVYNKATVTVIKTDSLGVSDGCMEYPITIYSEPDTPLVSNLTWTIYVDSLVTEIPSNMVDTTGTPTRNENMCTFVSLMETDNPGNFLELFPNPTHGQFTVTARSAISMVTVYDITGRRIMEEMVPGLLHYTADIEGQPAGLYLVQITIGEKVVIRKIAVE